MEVVLDNIRSLHNVGSIFRTADSLGIKQIYLCGYTPTPFDRGGSLRPQFSKVALGAEENVSWEKHPRAWRLLDNLKKDGKKIYAIEQDKKSIPYYSLPTTSYSLDKLVLVLGNEIDGLGKPILKRADKILEIPMNGKKESLNVSVALGVVAYALKYSS